MTYKVQIDDLVRDATPEEVEAIEANKVQALAKEEAEIAKATARQAVLDRLGITADEAKLLLS